MGKHIIKNFDELATNVARRNGLDILEAGYLAVQTKTIITSKITRRQNTLFIQGEKINFDAYKNVFLVGIGKCATDAAMALEEIIGDEITDGIVVDVRGAPLKKVASRVGTHPMPSEGNVEIARSIEKLIRGATEEDLIIVIISGGGSALLCLPHDIKCEKVAEISKELMDQGASIHEINTVRKHTSDIAGGKFARLAYPARIVSLIFSDVPGDDMSVIASGPTVMDKTTAEDACNILEKYDIKVLCELPYCELVETPKEEKYFENVSNILLATNETALFAMKQKAEELGYGAKIIDSKIEGEARSIGARILREAREEKECLLYGGETTVTVKGNGKGGRNQEVALGALINIQEGVILIAAASDGWDNSDVAGALVDFTARQKAEALSMSPKQFLSENNAYEFFKRTGAHIETGRTGINVADFYFTLTGFDKGDRSG